jgi:glycosyltransferase involved in cell wall biosynthesis
VVEVSLLVPVKDEVASLAQLAEEVTAAMAGAADGAGHGWELIFIDDGSTDGTWKEIVRLSGRDPRIRGLRLRRNFGKSAALSAGFAASTGAVIATLDGDLQDDPAEIPGMIALLGDSADLVAGHKAQRRDPLGKRLSPLWISGTRLLGKSRAHQYRPCGAGGPVVCQPATPAE